MVIDLLETKMFVLVNTDGWFDIAEFQEAMPLISLTFSELVLTVTQVITD